jgi:hypothetical protein
MTAFKPIHMDLNVYMTSCRNSILNLIKKYRAQPDAAVLANLQRMLAWRRDMLRYEDLRMGKTYQRSTEPYYPMLPMPHWDQSIGPLMPRPSLKGLFNQDPD